MQLKGYANRDVGGHLRRQKTVLTTAQEGVNNNNGGLNDNTADKPTATQQLVGADGRPRYKKPGA